MAKIKSKYVCQNCGYESAGYLGRCPDCGSWSSFVEEVANNATNLAVDLPDKNPPMRLSEIEMNSEIRIMTNISEFDRVLGGGIVQGSLVLIAGDPGIGKSTILLQTSGELCKKAVRLVCQLLLFLYIYSINHLQLLTWRQVRARQCLFCNICSRTAPFWQPRRRA